MGIRRLLGTLVLASSIALTGLAGAAQPALAVTADWWKGEYPLLLDYGCTTFELEPFDSRFNCPSGWRAHEAIDIGMPVGTPLYAGFPGTVTEVGGPEAHDYGPNYVKVWLDEGHDVNLGHLSKAFVHVGQKLSYGTPIGLSGDLGITNAPNLDFSVRPHGGGPHTSINPARFLDAPPAVRDAAAATDAAAGEYPSPVLLGGSLVTGLVLVTVVFLRRRGRAIPAHSGGFP